MKSNLQLLQKMALALSKLSLAGLGLGKGIHYLKRLKCLVGTMLIIAGTITAAQAQQLPGSNDLSFNTADTFFDVNGFNGVVNAVVLQGDSKIIVGGGFSSYSIVPCNRIARLNPDRSLDNTFNQGTGFNGNIYAIALQSDSRIVIGGSFVSFNNTPQNFITRLNTDGALDNSFNAGSGFNGPVRTIVQQKDGKLVVGGDFTSYNGKPCTRIARLNADGSLDEAFNLLTGFDRIVYSITLQNDGKLVIGGAFTSYNDTICNRITRLNADGSLDTNFTIGTGFDRTVHSTAVQSDGRILVGGNFASYNGTARLIIARLTADGTFDTSFNPNVVFSGATINAFVIQPDGKIVVGGSFTTNNGPYRSAICRFNTDGSLDYSFSHEAGFYPHSVNDLALLDDGMLVVGGNFTSYNGIPRHNFACLYSDGSLEEPAGPRTGFNNTIRSIALQSTGKMVVGGDFVSFNGVTRNRISRLHADGTLDESFNPGPGFDNSVTTIALQADGKVMVGGEFLHYGTVLRGGLARLQPDGSLDYSFSTGFGFNGPVFSVALQDDGKVIAGGNFTGYNNILSYNRIVRLNANGTLDASFNTGSGLNGQVHSVAMQPDGKVVIGGLFSTYNGTACKNIVRLHTNGSLDESFNPGTGFNLPMQTIVMQQDGKMVVGGSFTSYNGVTRMRIARLHTNGSLDETFDPGTGFNNTVLSIALQRDGKVIVGGNFISFNEASRNRIARLDPDGSLDNAFNPGAGFDYAARTIALQSDGKVVVGGEFTSYDAIPRTRIARLYGGEGTSLSSAKEHQPDQEVLLYPNPSQGDINLEFSVAAAMLGGAKLNLYNAMGKQVLAREVTASEAQSGVKLATTGLAGGVYFLKISTRSGNITKRVVLAE